MGYRWSEIATTSDGGDKRQRNQSGASAISSEFDKPRTGQNRIPSYDHRGTVIVAGAWLAFYLITAIHQFISSGN
jgi:hypothetical protein